MAPEALNLLFLAIGDTAVSNDQSAIPEVADLEFVGKPLGSVFLGSVGMFQGNNGQQLYELFQQKNGDANAPVVLSSLDLNTARLTALGQVAVNQIQRAISDGQSKLYLGSNGPALLLEFDFKNNSLQEVARGVFAKATAVYSMSVGEDGMLALGGLSFADVSLFDPKTRALKKYGPVGPGLGYVYTLGQTAREIHLAVRGADWQWVVVDKSTGIWRVILTLPAGGAIIMHEGGYARVKQPESTKYEWFVAQAESAVATAAPKLPRPAALPRVERLLDLNDGLNESVARFWWRFSARKPKGELAGTAPSLERGWELANIPVELIPRTISTMASDDLGNLHVAAHSPGTLATYNTDSGAFSYAGNLPLSVRSALVLRDRSLLGGGYSSSMLFWFRPDEPFTQRKGASKTLDTTHNPSLLATSHALDGALDVTNMVAGSDGRVYFAALRFGDADTFRLGWYDPATGEYGQVPHNGLFDHLSLSWMAGADEGRKIVIATRVEPDLSLSTPIAGSAKLFVYDVAAAKFVGDHTPFLLSRTLGSFAAVSADEIVGVSVEPPAGKFPGRTILYRYNFEAGCVTKVKAFKGMFPGRYARNALPRVGHGFDLAPDGFIWTLADLPGKNMPRVILRVDPETFAVASMGKLPSGHIRFHFDKSHVYLSGATRLMRIKN